MAGLTSALICLAIAYSCSYCQQKPGAKIGQVQEAVKALRAIVMADFP
jgi:hypothetical protein